jgi:catechol 2,3-dioxygenase-like lactoylglutathione lyase family enzyme
MALHRLTSITIGVPNVDEACAFYRDFGLQETAPGRFSTEAGGLAAWGPPVRPSFLAPDDIMDLLKAEAR